MELVIIGVCKIYFGDCLDVMQLLKSNEFDLLLTDPPYGIEWQTSSSRRKNVPEKIHLDDDRVTVHKLLCEAIKKIKSHRHSYIFGDWRDLDFPLGGRCELIWDKCNTTLSGANTPWAKQHEFISFGVKANKAQRAMNDGLRAAKMRRGSILRYQRLSGAAVKNHPTEKPINLLRELIESSTRIGDVIFDPFMGSGSSAVAAIKEDREFVGIEINREYFDIACRRIKEAYKQPDIFIEQQKSLQKQEGFL